VAGHDDIIFVYNYDEKRITTA